MPPFASAAGLRWGKAEEVGRGSPPGEECNRYSLRRQAEAINKCGFSRQALGARMVRIASEVSSDKPVSNVAVTKCLIKPRTPPPKQAIQATTATGMKPTSAKPATPNASGHMCTHADQPLRLPDS